jgi:uncharacterized protein
MDTDADGLGGLSRAEAIALLQTQVTGRLVHTCRALPAVTPVNFSVHAGDILIWTGSDPALGRAVHGAVVAFQVDDLDRVTRSGWSVTVTGTARLVAVTVAVTDQPELARLRLCPDGPIPGAPLPSVGECVIRIPIAMVTCGWL